MKIAIIGAMEVEIEYLCQSLENRRESNIHGFCFYEGTINNVTVIVLMSGIGKVSAAIATSLLIDCYSPDFVINTGVAGGLGKAKINDFLLATEVRYHDVDLTSLGYEMGQQANLPPAFYSDMQLLELAKDHCKQYTDTLLCGQVVSGDSFISNPDRLAWIIKYFPQALGVEMEAGAIAQACYQLEVPFVVLRAISDKAGEGNAKSYNQFVAKAGYLSAKMNVALIKEIAQKQSF